MQVLNEIYLMLTRNMVLVLVNSHQQRVSMGGVAELSKFCFSSYHLILNSNQFTCHLKGLVRWEVHGMLFFHILMFSLCSSYTLGGAELGEFCFVSYHLILDSNIFTCRLKCLVRWEAHSMPFCHISMFSLCSSYNLGVAELSQFCFISYHFKIFTM